MSLKIKNNQRTADKKREKKKPQKKNRQKNIQPNFSLEQPQEIGGNKIDSFLSQKGVIDVLVTLNSYIFLYILFLALVGLVLYDWNLFFFF